MIPFCCIVLTMIISIIPCQADETERAALFSMKGQGIPITETEPLNIPSWAVHVPEHSYVGISSPCPSIEEARQQALGSAIGQILQSMGAEYHLSHKSELSGDLNHSEYELNEHLSYTANWLLNSVQQNIKHYAFHHTDKGHVCFVLIRMKPSELEKLKRLTIGAKISARLIGINAAQVSIEVNESNGVSVTITEYRLTATIRHHHARFITLFLWKIPETGNISHEGALPHKLFMSNSSGLTTIPVFNGKDRLKSILMGSKDDISITLMGYDELGRSVSASVKIP